MPASEDLRPGDTVDRYTVVRELGRGGMAVVFLVRHNRLNSLHAFKLLTHSNPSIRERMITEGQLQASWRHRNLVVVNDVLDEDGHFGLLMDYIDGPSLEEWLVDHRPGVPEALSIFRGIWEGVRKAHSMGVVHRHLKPGNVFMAKDEGVWVPKVADFGLAKALAEDGGGMS